MMRFTSGQKKTIQKATEWMPPPGPEYRCIRCGRRDVTYTATYPNVLMDIDGAPVTAVSDVQYYCQDCGTIDHTEVVVAPSMGKGAVAAGRRERAEESLPASPLAKFMRRRSDEKERQAKVDDLLALRRELVDGD